MIRELIQTVKFLEPWQFALLAMFVQIGLLVGLAWLVYRRLEHSPREQHFVWLAALLAIGCALPLQLLLPGWTFQVERTTVNVGSDDSNSEFNSGVSDNEVDSASSDSTSTESNSIDQPFDRRGTQSEDNVVNDSGNSNEVNSELAIDSSSLNDVEDSNESSLATTTEASRQTNQPSGKRSWLGLLPGWKVILAIIYLMAFAWMLLRLLCGWWLLKSITGQELNADGRHGQLIDRVANQAQLKSVPQVLVSPDVSTPMAYGIRRPVVLLPQEFSTWNRECQEVVLSHEFCHIQRRDAVWDLVSRLISALYWFHPAVHFASQSLRKTRETATDLAVLNLGIAPASYARELLNVTTAKCSAGSVPAQSVPALRMAGEQDFEARVKRILRSPLAGQRNRSDGMSAMFHLGILTLFFIVIGMSLKMTIANVMIQEDEASTAQSDFPDEVDDKLVSGADFYTRVSKTQVKKRDAERSVTITGTIRDSSNQPVEDAIVILRNGMSMSASRNGRINDLLGKTKTDGQGRYSIVASEKVQGRYVRPELTAFSKSGQMGWIRIGQEQMKADSIALDLVMAETVAVKGRLVSESDAPIANAQVRVTSFQRQDMQRSTNYVGYNDRVISPQVTSDENGRFEFPALPANYVVSLTVSHPDYAEDFFYIRSSGDDRLWLWRPHGDEKIPVLKNGDTKVVEKGVSVSGVVLDSKSNPRSDVWVELLQRVVQTGEGGKFEFLINEQLLELRKELEFMVEHPDYQQAIFKFPFERSGSEEAILRLTRPVQVSGTVLAVDDRTPVSGMRMLISSSNGNNMVRVTDDYGHFKLMVPTGEVTVKVDGAVPGFKAMDRNRNTNDDKPGPFMRVFELEQIESKKLEPFLLERVGTYEVQVVDEAGDPVADAEVQLFSDDSGMGNFNLNSKPERTLQDGLVEVFPQAAPKGGSIAWARYEKDGQLFLGQVFIDKDKEVTQLKILPATEARGKVTLNGNPLPGIRVEVTSYTHQLQDIGGGRTVLKAKSSRIVGKVTTDENGEYRIPVSQLDTDGNPGDIFVGIAWGDTSGIPNPQASGSSRKSKLNDQGVFVQDIDFFEGPRTISGTVVDSIGDPVEGFFVALRNPLTRGGHDPGRHYRPSMVYTDHDGKFTLEGLQEDVVIPLRTGFWGANGSKREDFTEDGERKIDVAADESEIRITLELKK